jgi:hypothetical protein
MRSIALVAALCVSTVAHAGTRAWPAAKKVLPSGLMVVVDVDVSAIHGTKLFEALFPMLLAQKTDVARTLDGIKQACGLDPTQVIDSFVAGTDEQGQGAIVIALKGITQKDVDACFAKGVNPGEKLVVTKAGALTKYSEGSTTFFVRWLDKSTLAVSTSADNKDVSEKTTSGGIAKDKTMMAGIAGVKLDATMWAVLDHDQPLDALGTKASQVFGSATVAGGKVDADLHLVVPDADSATKAAATANTQLGAFKDHLPAKLQPIAKTLSIKAVENKLVVTDSASEQDVVALLASLLQ